MTEPLLRLPYGFRVPRTRRRLLTPEEASAEFYGFYSVVNKFSAIWGPLIFAWVRQTTGSGRNAILALIVLFVLGGLLLALVDVEEARRSRLRWRFEGAEADAA